MKLLKLTEIGADAARYPVQLNPNHVTGVFSPNEESPEGTNSRITMSDYDEAMDIAEAPEEVARLWEEAMTS